MKDIIKDSGTEKRTLGQKKGHWDRKKDNGTEKRTKRGRKEGQKNKRSKELNYKKS
jgi:hypothetical protein